MATVISHSLKTRFVLSTVLDHLSSGTVYGIRGNSNLERIHNGTNISEIGYFSGFLQAKRYNSSSILHSGNLSATKESLKPQDSTSNRSSHSPITSSDLTRLHRLSALNPPPRDSLEESELLEGLNELVGLMEGVKQIELPAFNTTLEREEWVRELLSYGVGEVVIGEEGNGDGNEDLDLESDQPQIDNHVQVDQQARDEMVRELMRSGLSDSISSTQEGKNGRDLLDYATRRVGDYYASKAAVRSEDKSVE